MSICDGCIHDNVCGLEDNHEDGIVSCADMIPNDVLDKIRADLHYNSEMHEDGNWYLMDKWVDEILDKYKAKDGEEE